MTRWFSIQLFFLFTILSSLHSQEGWRQLTTDDGLSSNGINTIYQAKNGDIWIGTDEGINRHNSVFEDLWALSFPVNIIFEFSASYSPVRIGLGALGSGGFESPFFWWLEWKDIDTLDDVSKMPEFAVESAGKLWIPTQGGIVGYDGHKWQQCDAKVDVNWLVKTPDGRLWTKSEKMDSIASFNGQKWTVFLILIIFCLIVPLLRPCLLL